MNSVVAAPRKAFNSALSQHGRVCLSWSLDDPEPLLTAAHHWVSCDPRQRLSFRCTLQLKVPAFTPSQEITNKKRVGGRGLGVVVVVVVALGPSDRKLPTVCMGRSGLLKVG